MLQDTYCTTYFSYASKPYSRLALPGEVRLTISSGARLSLEQQLNNKNFKVYCLLSNLEVSTWLRIVVGVILSRIAPGVRLCRTAVLLLLHQESSNESVRLVIKRMRSRCKTSVSRNQTRRRQLSKTKTWKRVHKTSCMLRREPWQRGTWSW